MPKSFFSGLVVEKCPGDSGPVCCCIIFKLSNETRIMCDTLRPITLVKWVQRVSPHLHDISRSHSNLSRRFHFPCRPRVFFFPPSSPPPSGPLPSVLPSLPPRIALVLQERKISYYDRETRRQLSGTSSDLLTTTTTDQLCSTVWCRVGQHDSTPGNGEKPSTARHAWLLSFSPFLCRILSPLPVQSGREGKHQGCENELP